MQTGLNWIPTIVFIAGIIFIIVKMKKEEEPYYILKILGYYFIGTFRFSFNKLHIPLGFIAFLLFLRNPQKNRRGKRYAAILGLFAFILALMIPAITESYYERTRYVEPAATNLYEFDFQGHWKGIAKTLDLDENSIGTARIEDLHIDYEKDGELKSLSYEVTWREQGQLHHASVFFHETQKKFRVRAVKVSEWLQYNRLISTERLFKRLNRINMRNLTPEGDYPYYGFIFGGWDNFGIKDGEMFIIEENRIAPFTGELPVEACWIKTFGMKKTGEHSYSSTGGHYYLFDVKPDQVQ